MKHSSPHILLVNPWITDFAAYNLWSRPLGLLEIGGILRDTGFQVSLIDCVDAENFSVTEPFSPRLTPYGTGKLRRTPIEKPEILASVPRRYCRYGISIDDFSRRLAALRSPDLILVTSIMTYWYPGVRDAIMILRRAFPQTPIWLGGNYATLLPRHALTACKPDRVIPGPFTRETLREIIKILGRPSSPAESEFSGLPFWEGYGTHHFLCVKSSHGCPFHCQYCASNLLHPFFNERAIDEVAREISRGTRLFGARDVAFYDDALLVNARARFIPLLRNLLEAGLSLRFHTPNGIHIRLMTTEIAELMKASGFHTLRLSLEAVQPAWQERFGSKTTLKEFDQALSALFRAGFTTETIKVYLLVGLPGQTMKDVLQSVREVLKRGVKPSLAEYSPIPGTAFWEEACRVSPYPLKEEPLTHNNTLLPCGGREITKAALDGIKHIIASGQSSNPPKNGASEPVFPSQEEPDEEHS